MGASHLKVAEGLLEQTRRLEAEVGGLIREGSLSGHLNAIGEVMSKISGCAHMLVREFSQASPGDTPDEGRAGQGNPGMEMDRMLHLLKELSLGMKSIGKKIENSLAEDAGVESSSLWN